MKDSEVKARLSEAVKHFWATRSKQRASQGNRTGKQDYGERTAVTGGAQMDGFVELVRDILVSDGVPAPSVFCRKGVDLPGYFRPTKDWDLVAVAGGHLLATVEFKSQVGPSFGNNFNNRSEEAIGSATDFRMAYREGAFSPSIDPWLGYIMLLEDVERSRRPVKVKESHFRTSAEFHGASYADRYEILLTRLLRERLYDGACLLLTAKDNGQGGHFNEPSTELSFQNFIVGLRSRAIAFVKTVLSS